MKRILLAVLIIALGATTACSSALSHGDKTSDNAHSFLIHSTQIIDKIGEDVALEDQAYLVIKYEVENLQAQNDSTRRWADQIKLEASEENYAPTFLDALDNQLWETQLLGHEKKAGYMAFTVPDKTFDCTLTFTFPTSETEAAYELRAVDKRVGVSVDWVLTRLGQIENTKRIPLIGRPLALANPIRYQGIILVPKEDISQLLDKTNGLSDDAKKAVIEDYLITHGHCRLE
ncbi:MAG TPA: DUF4352 domain-containing protein [Dehalococcoidales bacterium]